jgi:hypothetical protein
MRFTRIFALTLGLVLACTLSATAQTAITPTVETEAVGLYSSQDQAWHPGEIAGVSVKAATFGTVSQNNFYVIAHQLSVSDFHEIAYMGGIRFQPDISGLLGAHTVLPVTITVHFDAEVGNTIDTSSVTSVNHMTQKYGGGVSVPVYDSDKAEIVVHVINASYLRVGDVNNGVLTAGASIIFGGSAAQETARHRSAGRLARARARNAFKNAGW